MVRTMQANGTQALDDPVELQTIGHTTLQPARPTRIAAAPFGDGLKRLPEKLRDLGAHDFEVNSFIYSGRRAGQSFATPRSKAGDATPSPAPPAIASDPFRSAATSSRRTDADMSRVIGAFAPANASNAASSTIVADAVHTLAKSALSTENACVAELLLLSERRYVSAYFLAEIFASLGDVAEAIAWLEKAYEERAMIMSSLRNNPRFDSLRSDPRFTSLEGHVGFWSGRDA